MDEFENKIIDLASKYQAAGNIQIYCKEQLKDNIYFGYEELTSKCAIDSTTHYTFPIASPLITALILLQLIETRKVSLTDTLDMYLTNFKHGKEITILEILNGKNGLVDYHNHLLIKEQNKVEYQNLSLVEQQLFDYKFKTQLINNEQYLNFLNDTKLQSRSQNEYYVTCFIRQLVIEKVTNQTFKNYLANTFFASLGIKIIMGYYTTSASYSFLADNKMHALIPNSNMTECFTISLNNIGKFFYAFYHYKIVSKKSYKLMLPTLDQYMNISLYREEGFICCDLSFLRTFASAMYSPKLDLLIIMARNSFGNYFHDAISTKSFYIESMDLIKARYFNYCNPKLVPFSKKYYDSASTIKLLDEQYEFVSAGICSIAWASTEKKAHLYVLVDNQIAVGLCILYVDKAENEFGIYDVKIDWKYQNKGYGKFLIKEALKIIQKYGAKRIIIGVDKKNVTAKKIYLANGFTVHKATPTSYELQWSSGEYEL